VGRFGLNSIQGKEIIETNIDAHDFMNPGSTLNNRKDFRKDDKNKGKIFYDFNNPGKKKSKKHA
jgi:hypothetical protein